MLILTRKKGQKIILGDRLVTIKVMEVYDNSVKFGIDAPKDLSVHREEIYEQIQSAKNKGEN